MKRCWRVSRAVAGGLLAVGLIVGMTVPAGAVGGAGFLDGPDEVVSGPPGQQTFSFPQIELFGTVSVPGGNPYTGWMYITGLGGPVFGLTCAPVGSIETEPLCAPGAGDVLLPYGGPLTNAAHLAGTDGQGNYIIGTCGGAAPGDLSQFANWNEVSFACTATTTSGGNGTFRVSAQIDHGGGYIWGAFATDAPV